MGEFTRPKVPEGVTEYVTTTQKEIVPGQFVIGYTTEWVSFQKEVPYQTPKKPQPKYLLGRYTTEQWFTGYEKARSCSVLFYLEFFILSMNQKKFLFR